ncbi:pilus (MSHA type) biogenesis protein MshL [Azovibrio restrictus]|uniref:pilus (MSHA type) biogenesis protein MshL n=1 Tax=Azovibrio restrictus TaxID=146938 RepID=UPI0026EF1BEE|nr:pilus (MSHA type) biogenesis protein MshL [Azovibrio restrictus]MDD3482265.1 pilus (MSHA type) biogenesis protein MshL [Azovibrio restrictus]
MMKKTHAPHQGKSLLLPGLLLALLLSGCSPMLPREGTYDSIQSSLQQQPKPDASGEKAAIDAALLPPIQLPTAVAPQPLEPRFDLAVAEAPAAQVFLALVDGTRYSMLLPPDVSGSITLNLKNVTVREALEVIRDLYGYDFRIQGNRISVQPNTPQTRIFQVSYLASKRGGTSATRVVSSNASNNGSSNGSSGSSSSSTRNNVAVETTNVFTGQVSDFWLELGVGIATALDCKYEVTSDTGAGANSGLMGQMLGLRLSKLECPEGRRFLMNQQSGTVMVRALPAELREVNELLKAMQAGVERQVMLEAKLIEVELNDGFQSGVNWTAFDKFGRQRWGMNANNNQWPVQSQDGQLRRLTSETYSSTEGTTRNWESVALSGASGLLNSFPVAGALGLSFQTSDFASIIQFLETQGTVYVMSNPRIATLNNQKAVLKVGSDDYYVTGVEPGTTTVGSGTNNTFNPPTITAQPFFSGIALDVTPQIDDAGMITLHIRPAVTEVTTKELVVNLGSQAGTYTLPFASSRVKETDSIVRVKDGMIVAIGGMMSQEQAADESKVPGAGDIPFFGHFFKQTNRATRKREMVVLIKPTVIHGEGDWQQDMDALNQRLKDYDPRKYPALADPVTAGRGQDHGRQ